MKKRILSMLLCIFLVILMVDINAYAIELSDGTNVEIDENTKRFGDNLYKIIGRHSRDIGVQKCKEAGGHLVTINSKEEQQFIDDWMFEYYGSKNKTGACWLGAIFDGTWQWITGEEFKFTNWNDGEPSGDGIYLIFNRDGRWNDGNSGSYVVICEWDGVYKTIRDKILLENVKMYTSDGGIGYVEQLNRIIAEMEADDVSQTEKLRRYNEFFVQKGFMDGKEGISYCNDALNAKQAYDYLVLNDAHCAYQYWDFLHFTNKGKAARASLLLDEWVFNDGLLQYIDPSTYITGETESIKNYKTMLLDFMNHYSQEYEVLKYADNVISTIESGIKVTNGTYKESYIRKINNAKTNEEITNLFTEYLDEAEWIVSDDGKMEINIEGFSSISKLTEKADKITTACTDVLSYATDFILLESRLNVIESNAEFLKKIVDGKDVLPYGMVVAAEQLLSELINPYIASVAKAFGQLGDYVVNDTYDFRKQVFGEGFGGFLATVDMGAKIVDQITGIGTLVKQSTYVEGYAFLGVYYSNLLQEAKSEFLSNETIENAYNFYDIYMTLLQLRIKGEEAYLEMNEAKGLVDILCKIGDWDYFGLSDKEAYVNENVQFLKNRCRFGVVDAEKIENDILYKMKIIVACPVNVDIYDSNKNIIYSFANETEVDEINTYGRFICKYVPASGDYVKVAYLNEATGGDIKIVGEDTGVVTCSVIETVDNSSYTSKGFEGIPISENGIITMNSIDEYYYVDENGDGITDITANQIDKTKIYIQFDCQNGKEILTVYADDEGRVVMPQIPEKEGYSFKGWYEEIGGNGKKLEDTVIVETSKVVYAFWEETIIESEDNVKQEENGYVEAEKNEEQNNNTNSSITDNQNELDVSEDNYSDEKTESPLTELPDKEAVLIEEDNYFEETDKELDEEIESEIITDKVEHVEEKDDDVVKNICVILGIIMVLLMFGFISVKYIRRKER